jgi:hypothetical protein
MRNSCIKYLPNEARHSKAEGGTHNTIGHKVKNPLYGLFVNEAAPYSWDKGGCSQG